MSFSKLASVGNQKPIWMPKYRTPCPLGIHFNQTSCQVARGAFKVKCGVVRESLVPDASPFGEVQPFYFVLGVVQHMAQNIRCKDEQVWSQWATLHD
jgi:hypothetical protein